MLMAEDSVLSSIFCDSDSDGKADAHCILSAGLVEGRFTGNDSVTGTLESQCVSESFLAIL